MHKKESKDLTENYRLISLLPIFSKNFERLTFNYFFNCFMQNKLFTEFQLDSISGDSCVAQLVSITYEIYENFVCNPPADMTGIFLDI